MQNDAIHIKKELRHEALTRRDAMLASAREQASHAICRKLKDRLAYLSAGSTVAVYAPMKSEVNLGDFIAWCYTQKLTVVFPCMNTKGSTPRMYMRLAEYRAWRDGNVPFIDNPLKRFAEDDESVSDFPVCAPEFIDAVIVPMVAFDSDFQRLGYGGGNYDEYLGLVSREKTLEPMSKSSVWHSKRSGLIRFQPSRMICLCRALFQHRHASFTILIKFHADIAKRQGISFPVFLLARSANFWRKSIS
mgnify:CR=1 FL=1